MLPKVFLSNTSLNAINIGRDGIYGNPFKITAKINRKDSIVFYHKYFYSKANRKNRETLVKEAEKLIKNHNEVRLYCPGCQAIAKPCHGETLIAYLTLSILRKYGNN